MRQKRPEQTKGEQKKCMDPVLCWPTTPCDATLDLPPTGVNFKKLLGCGWDFASASPLPCWDFVWFEQVLYVLAQCL